MLRVFADAGLPVERRFADGVYELTFPLPSEDAGNAGQLPGRRGRAGAPRRRRQPAARVRARVGRGDRREPAPGHGGPGHPGQHQGRRVRRPPLRGEPARPADRRRAVPVLGARPARAGRPGGDRGARRRRCSTWRSSCGQRGVRSLVVVTAGLDTAAERRPARGVPQARHAAGRPGLLRGGRARHRPGRHVRRPARASGRGRPGHAVRRPGLRHGRPPVPARHRDLLVRVGRRQARRVRQRHAAVVGTRRADQARRAVHRVVRQPAQVRPDGPPGQRRHARAHRAGRPRRARPRRGQPGGAVRAGRRHRHARLRRADPGHRAAGHPARPGRAHRRDRVQRRQRRRCWPRTPAPTSACPSTTRAA